MAAPFTDGDLRGLTWGSRRWSLAKSMRLVAAEGAANGIVSEQYVALLTGADVTLTTLQVKGFLPASQWPDDIDASDAWLLAGDELTPA
jgi:hypothetical protein